MYQHTKTLQTLEAGVCMEIKFPAYGGTDQIGFKIEISGFRNQLSEQMKKMKKKQIKSKLLAANIKLFEPDTFYMLLQKCNLWKFLRITP